MLREQRIDQLHMERALVAQIELELFGQRRRRRRHGRAALPSTCALLVLRAGARARAALCGDGAAEHGLSLGELALQM